MGTSGLTTLGIWHTVISLIAVISGAIALLRDKKISWTNTIGKIYVVTTIITCVSGFGIYQHGGFGKAHVLGIITLLIIGLALSAEMKSNPFGRLSPYIATVAYSMTFFLHLIPGVTETSTRLPAASPLVSDPNDPHLQMVIGVLFLLFVLGSACQLRKLKAELQK